MSYMCFNPNAVHSANSINISLVNSVNDKLITRGYYQIHYRVISAKQDYRLHEDVSRIYNMQPVDSGNLYGFTPC